MDSLGSAKQSKRVAPDPGGAPPSEERALWRASGCCEFSPRLSTFPDSERSSRLCEVAAEVTDMSGAGIMLMSGDVSRGSLCSSNAVSALIEDLQFTLGEGPCVDAYHHDRPVLEPDLADPDTARWLAFSPPAVRGRAYAPCSAFPIQVGVVTARRAQPLPRPAGPAHCTTSTPTRW